MKKNTLFCGALALLLCLALTGCRDRGPTEAELARSQGISYMEAADYENAVAAFENAYSLCDERMPETKTDIALYEADCQYRLGDYEGMTENLSRVLALGENADAYYLRGSAFLQLGQDDAAKADFDAAAALEPTDYGLLLDIYKQYESVSRSAVGDAYLQQALAIPGEELEDYYQKGSIYFYLKDYQKAQELLAKPAEAKHKDAMMLMGQVYLALGDSVQARSIYQQYLEEFGDDPAAYNGIVLCEIADGNYSAAITAAETGIALEAGDDEKRDLYYNEIVAYEKQYDFSSAREKAAAFVEKYPDDEEGQKEYDFLSTR